MDSAAFTSDFLSWRTDAKEQVRDWCNTGIDISDADIDWRDPDAHASNCVTIPFDFGFTAVTCQIYCTFLFPDVTTWSISMDTNTPFPTPTHVYAEGRCNSPGVLCFGDESCSRTLQNWKLGNGHCSWFAQGYEVAITQYACHF